jgi:hypothetical protein
MIPFESITPRRLLLANEFAAFNRTICSFYMT